LANIHHFSRVGHSSFTVSTRPTPAPFPYQRALLGDSLALSSGSEGFRCPEHISASKNPGSERISVFFGVFSLFSGIPQMQETGSFYMLWYYKGEDTICRGITRSACQSRAKR